MKINFETYFHSEPLGLEGGETLNGIEISYTTSGILNTAKDNVVWVFHALTANQNPFEWWEGLFGNGDFFNPDEYFIVCANVLGSCYGTTGPTSMHLGHKYRGRNFPLVTIRDIVKVHRILQNHLQLSTIKIAIGGSFGGYQALEFAYDNTTLDHLILIATSAIESPWNIAIHEAQRQAIRADSSTSGSMGLAAARAIGMIMYRTPDLFKFSQGRNPDQIHDFRASSYIRYQGEKLVKRFDTEVYFKLTESLDTHDLGRGRGTLQSALSNISAKTLLIGIQEDLIASEKDMIEMSKYIPLRKYMSINSIYGHDGFLIETEKIAAIINEFLNTEST